MKAVRAEVTILATASTGAGCAGHLLRFSGSPLLRRPWLAGIFHRKKL
nr:hypothetical protein [uncultured Desulfobulbus sp.]